MKPGFYAIKRDGKPSITQCIHEIIDGEVVVYFKVIGSEDIFDVSDLRIGAKIEIHKLI